MATTTFDKPVGSNQILTSDVVDNLTTNNATKVLSAKQGYVLNSNKYNRTSYAIAGNNPTNTEISTFISTLSGTGSFIVDFTYNDAIRASMMYTCISKNYGQGVIISSYYDIPKVVYKNSSGLTIDELALNSDIATKTGTLTFAENVNGSHVSLQKSGNLIALIGYVTITSEMNGNAQLFTLPTGFRPAENQYAMAYADNYNSNKTTDILYLRTNGICSGAFGSSKNFGANSHVFFNVTFCC